MDIREIAGRARVSTSTVSRTINRIPSVNPQLAKRVWNVVEELGFQILRLAHLYLDEAGFSASSFPKLPIPSFPRSCRYSSVLQFNTTMKSC
jgi:hypothetical protein